MADPTFNREKAEAVLRQWFGAYGANQIGTTKSGYLEGGGEAAFIQELINKSDPERVLWGDDSNSLISEIERVLNRGASTSDVTTILGNISAAISDWDSFITGDRTGKTVADKLADAFTDEAIAEQSTAMGLELREEGFSDKQMLKKYEQFVGRILPKTTAGLTLSGFDPTTQTQVRNAINGTSANGLSGIDQAKLRIAEAFATGLNDSDEPIDFTNEDTILKSLSNVQVDWGGKSTTTNPNARDLAITSLMLSKGPSSPSAYQSWIAKTFKDTASVQDYLTDPSQHQETGTASGTANESTTDRFSQDVRDQVSDGSLKWKGWQQGSDQTVGQFTDDFGNTVRYTAYLDKTGTRKSSQGTSELVGPEESWQEAVARQRQESDSSYQEDQIGLARDEFDFNKQKFGIEIAEKMRQFDELSAADQKTFEQRFKFWNNLSAAEKATLEQNNFQFDNLSAAEEQSFKQDMFKFQNVSASDQASLDLQQQMFKGVSGNTQATLDQDMFKFANISALDTAQLAQDESQFSRNLAQDESQFSRNLGESGRQFNIGEAGDTLRTQIGTQPALMGAITDRDRLMNEMLSQGGNYLARAFNQYGQAAPTDQPSVADRVNALRAQTVEQNALAQMGADAANDAIKQAEYQKYMQTAAQGAQARWEEYVAANTSTTGGGTYEFANPNFNADDIATQRANLTKAAQEAQAKADYFSGTDYTDPITKQVYEADIFPQGVPDIGFQAAAAQPHLDAATAAQAALDNYQAPSQFLTGENPAESVYTGMNRNQWNQQYGQANNMQDWWNTVADQPAMQQRFTQPDLAPVQPMTSMEELVALSRGFLSPASQDVYFGDAARPRTGFGFALPSYQQLQRLAPEERDALNTAMLTEFNVPLANAVFEERLRGQPTRTTAPAASARPTQMFRRTPYGTTNTGLRQSTAPMAQVREASRQPMFRSS